MDIENDKKQKLDWHQNVYTKTKTRKIPAEVRNNVRKRDNNNCQVSVCRSKTSLSCHHIIPRNDGGLDIEDNLILLCAKCHDEIEGLEIQLRERSTIRSFIPQWYVANQECLNEKVPILLTNNWQSWVYGGSRNPNI